jgi:hypothetical protein
MSFDIGLIKGSKHSNDFFVCSFISLGTFSILVIYNYNIEKNEYYLQIFWIASLAILTYVAFV